MRRRTDERGFAMVAVLMVMLLLMGIAGAIHTQTLGETQLRGANAVATAGFYAAEAGINRGIGDYQNIFMSFNQPSGSDFDEKTLTLGDRTVRYQLQPGVCPGGTCPYIAPIPAGQPFAGLNSQSYTYVARATSEIRSGDVETTLGTEFDVNVIPLFQFLAFYQRDLEINPGPTMHLHGPIHTNANLYMNSNNTLYIEDSPPDQPTVSVTAAGNIYRGRKDVQNSPRCGGTVTVDMLADANNDGQLDPRNLVCSSSTTATSQTDTMLAPWLGSMRARQLAVGVPQPSVLNRGGTYWSLANLRLALDLDDADPVTGLHPIVVLQAGDPDAIDVDQTLRLQAFMTANPGRVFYNDVPTLAPAPTFDVVNCVTGAPGATNYCNPNKYSPAFTGNPLLGLSAQGEVYACAGSVAGCGSNYIQTLTANGYPTARRGGFYNNREHAWVYMLNVNLHDLLVWNRAQPVGSRLIADPDTNANGGLVIFLSVKGPNSTGALPGSIRYGVRVFGTPNLDFPPAGGDPTGATVVSDQAIYVEGNYNVSSGQPGYDADHPKMPAAFMGDTVNVLSANWSGVPDANGCRNDCQSGRSLSSGLRTAANTYINAAFLGGVDDTVVGSTTGYNGGFENYPRFHESWSGATLTYRGSFVTLGVPSHANGAWCGTGGSSTSGCNIYNPPGRAWDYDTDFQNSANLPPITPQIVSVQQILFTENFR